MPSSSTVSLEVRQLVGDVDLSVGGSGVHKDQVEVEVEECGDRAEDLRGDLVQCVEQEVHRRVCGVIGESGAAVDRDPLGDPPGAGQLAARSSARWATSANSTRSTVSPSSRRPVATRRIAAPTPSRSQTRSSVQAPPRWRESSTWTSAPAAALIACTGVRNREIEPTGPRGSSSVTGPTASTPPASCNTSGRLGAWRGSPVCGVDEWRDSSLALQLPLPRTSWARAGGAGGSPGAAIGRKVT